MTYRILFFCALWMAVCMALGIVSARRIMEKLRILESFSQWTAYLEDTVIPLSLTVPDACMRFAQGHQGMAADFSRSLALRLRQQGASSNPIRDLLEEMKLSDEEWAEELCILSHSLTAQSAQELERSLSLCRHGLEGCLARCRESLENRARLYRTLGFMAGALGVIWGI